MLSALRFDADLKQLARYHEEHNPLGIEPKPVEHFDRYGVLRIDEENRAVRFEEKGCRVRGQINGGIYALHRKRLRGHGLPERYSREADFLEQVCREVPLHGFAPDAPFINIGNPKDYRRAGEGVGTR